MGARAVYNNQSLMIYITGPDVDILIGSGELDCSVWIGKELLSPNGATVKLKPISRLATKQTLEGERGAVAAVKAQLLAAHPELARSRTRRREERRKRAKRSTSPDVPD